MAERVHLAANNADLGGGEQVLVRTAAALLALGRPVTVVAPDRPTDVLDAASAVGAEVVAIRADGRRDHLRRLRAWDRARRDGLLWCHGLVPSLATAGHRRRVVHLHQLPRSRAQWAALAVARRGSERVLTPSAYLAGKVRGAQVLANWTDDVAPVARPAARGRVGFMGRFATDKGLDLVATAVAGSPTTSLVVAGDDRWVPAEQLAPVDSALAVLGDRVRRLGRVDPRAFFDEVDLAVFPSRVAESFGLVVAEAMAAEVPFVVSDAGALPEVAGPGHPWVARSGDADDLARVVREALAATPEEVRDVTDRARARWQEHYSPQAGRLRVDRLLSDLGVT
ncbi:glycosyltransferase involved in cell wall biosynthesis [Nocardioides cavernae]|uniref:Glycosyltransferase involved in cell wall biosynthesis n=1 Tax=Nocardioides cavernae TaxID=1921566 RepID=A0A7Y9H0M5_9ACTN|nr:glycosyltransferase family 4 protein [Nocardioides cavernae]NYE35796.1 glycosyltransferase involved in cell wall biosynthesis [Nocardioides cavernae]